MTWPQRTPRYPDKKIRLVYTFSFSTHTWEDRERQRGDTRAQDRNSQSDPDREKKTNNKSGAKVRDTYKMYILSA